MKQQVKIKFAKYQAINDPLYSKSWHIFNDGSGNGSRANVDLNVVPVWEKVCKFFLKIIIIITFINQFRATMDLEKLLH